MSLTCVTKCFVLTIFYTWFSSNLIQLNHAGGVFYVEIKPQYIFNLRRIGVLQNKFCFMEGKVDRFNQPCSNSIVPTELFQFRAVYEVAVPICFSGCLAWHSCTHPPKKGGCQLCKILNSVIMLKPEWSLQVTNPISHLNQGISEKLNYLMDKSYILLFSPSTHPPFLLLSHHDSLVCNV